jgi:hypothetical protein
VVVSLLSIIRNKSGGRGLPLINMMSVPMTLPPAPVTMTWLRRINYKNREKVHLDTRRFILISLNPSLLRPGCYAGEGNICRALCRERERI